MFQRIDILSKDFDNIVELELGAPWPLPPVEVTATLAHKFELIGWLAELPSENSDHNHASSIFFVLHERMV